MKTGSPRGFKKKPDAEDAEDSLRIAERKRFGFTYLL
jgi:transposase